MPTAKQKPRPNKLAPTDSPRDVKVAVDAKLKKLWDQTLGVIQKAKGRGAEAAAFAKILTGIKLPSDEPAGRAASKRTASK